MVASINDFTLDQLSEEFAKDFSKSLPVDEQVLFRTAAAETLLHELEDANVQHKDSSTSRKASAAVLPLVAGIEQYGRALDVFANSSDLLSPIWGSVRVVLHLAKEFGEYFDRLAAMLKDIAVILNRLPRSMRLYPENKILQSSVIAIYKCIAGFFKRAQHVFRIGKTRCRGLKAMKNVVSLTAAVRLLWTPFNEQFGEYKKEIEKSVIDIETEADISEKELANQERVKNDVRWSKVEASQQRLAEVIDYHSMTKVNNWLSPSNVASNHRIATNLRHGDSGTWFLQGETFQQWLRDENSFLWLHAIPGAGKTVLASSIVNYLENNVQSESVGLAYFYCDYKDLQKQEPSKVLGTVLATLAKQNKAVFEAIQSFFLQQYKESSTFTAEFDELLNNFGGFVNGHFNTVFLVIDALDEAGTAHMECLAYALKLLHQHCRSLKILVTSRKELPIARAFEDLPNTSIEQDDVASDIRNFITAELSAKISLRKLKLRKPSLETTIRDRLVEGSNGMFQWANCQIDTLCKLRNDKAIEAALYNLPRTLQEMYLRILQRVEDDHSDDVDTVRKILCWLVRGVRNLTLEELAEAVAVDPDCDETFMNFDAVDNDPEDVLEVLGGLVTVSSDRMISLAHYSVKEFLVSDDLKKRKPNFWIDSHQVEGQIAAVCLTYLCYDDFKRPELLDEHGLEERLNEYKLFRYAAQAWGIHAHLSEKDGRQPEEVVSLTMRLFHSRGELQANFDSWIECYRYCKFSTHSRSRASEPLFFAALFGLTKATSTLLKENNVDPKLLSESFIAAAANGHASVAEVFLEHSKASTDEELGILQKDLPKALYAAAAKGHGPVVSLLLRYGAPIDSRGGKDGTALQAASLEGRADVVKILLDKGANYWEACKRYGTPLAAAAEKAHKRTFGTLLEHGASPNGRGGWYSLPLVSAIVGKNKDIIWQLVNAGADLNQVGGRHGGPLPAAAAFGMNELIEDLVSAGAKVNDDDDKASDALYAASLAGHTSTVNLLLSLGADVDAKGGRHRNALGVASSEGHLEVVEVLLDAGADVDFFDEHWGNAIQIAAQRGHVETVQTLAEAGQNPDAEAGDKGTALVCAAANAHDSVIKVLFSLGVPSGSTEQMTSALVAASFGGHSATIQLLIENGADVNRLNRSSQTSNYCTPLQAAASKGHLEVAELLIKHGAGSHTDEGWFGTALTAAVNASGQREQLLASILRTGADPNGISPAACHFHGSPLVHAVNNCDIECTTIMLDAGADVNLQWPTFLSPLQTAASCGNEEIFDLLLARGATVNLISEPMNLRSSIESGLERGTITALQTAAWHGREQMVRRLVGLGADMSVTVDDAPFISALQAAAYRGHADTVATLIELGGNVNERGGYFGSPLQAASCKGHDDVVRILLEAGATSNEINIGYFRSALLAASRIWNNTNLAVIKLLVEHGADVNQKQKGPYPYPLHATCKFFYSGDDSPTAFLLQSGADPNASGGRFGTALQAAASTGDDDTCVLLLDKGADPNITGGFYNTPLQGAYRSGYYIVIAHLYQHGALNNLTGGTNAGSALGQALGGPNTAQDDGASCGACSTLVNQLLFHHELDPNLEYGRFGNPLQNTVMTSIWRNTGVDEIQMVLNAGADVNKVGGRMGTALTAAAWVGDTEAITRLLERGADMQLGNYRYPNPAFAAIRGCKKDALKLLIEKGIKVKGISGQFGTAVQYATHAATMEILRMVLRADAETNANPCGVYGAPLQAAAWRGREDMVRYLVHRGADIRAKGGRFGGVLNAAALECTQSLVEWLLKKGADVNEPGRVYGTPLQAAVCEGDIGVVFVLLRYGANINATGGKYWTALQAACAAGRFTMVKVLVERGADLNLVGGHYRTPLHAAAIRGDEDIVQYLLGAGAECSPIDRKRLGHIKSTSLDKAEELLERTKKPIAVAKAQMEAEKPEKGTEEEEEADRVLPWNAESIPYACDPYEPRGSKWTAVRELSFHTLSQRIIKTMHTNGLAQEPLPEKADSFDLGFNALSRTSTASSGRSLRAQKRQNSRKLTLDSQGEGRLSESWDTTALSWVQV